MSGSSSSVEDFIEDHKSCCLETLELGLRECKVQHPIIVNNVDKQAGETAQQ